MSEEDGRSVGWIGSRQTGSRFLNRIIGKVWIGGQRIAAISLLGRRLVPLGPNRITLVTVYIDVGHAGRQSDLLALKNVFDGEVEWTPHRRSLLKKPACYAAVLVDARTNHPDLPVVPAG